MSLLRDYIELRLRRQTQTVFEQAFQRFDLVATGRSIGSVETEVTDTPGGNVRLTVFARAEIEYVLNGRGPGLPPPIPEIEDWLRGRGLDYSPFAVARRIAERGTQRRNTAPIFFNFIDEQLVPTVDDILNDPRAENVFFSRLNQLNNIR
ncbi:MAG: hypothetical protein AAFO96_03650 [Bacteroidota bacterium]